MDECYKTMNVLTQFKTFALQTRLLLQNMGIVTERLKAVNERSDAVMHCPWRSLEHESVRRMICFDWIDITNHVHLRHAAMIAIATRFV